MSPDEPRLGEVRSLVEAIALEAGLDRRHRYALKLAVHEAVLNAIQHGGCPRDRRVRLWLAAHEQGLDFEVTDFGRFRNGSASAGSVEHGRGLTLVCGLMDVVRIDTGPGGTTVRGVKRRTPGG